MSKRRQPAPHTLGGRLGPRLAHLTSRAMTHHLRASAHTRAKIGAASLDYFAEGIGTEVKSVAAGFLSEWAEHPDLPEQLRPLFRFMVHGKGELQAILGAAATAQAVTPGLGTVLGNLLAPVIQSFLSKTPNALLPAAALADLQARGRIDQGQAHDEGRRQAMSPGRMDLLKVAAEQIPDVGSLTEFRRRGLLDDAGFRRALQHQGINPDWHSALGRLTRVHLSPADAADMVVRGIVTEEQGAEIAKVSGLERDDFSKLVKDTGEPPAVEELLFAYRRGIIDRRRLEHGIRQGRTKNEWLDVIESLRFLPMSTSDAIRASVQNHLGKEQARKIALENGLREQDFDPLFETEGNPIAAGEALELLNRGEMSQREVEQAIREGRTKNKYIPAYLKLRRRLMPERTVVSAVRQGALTHGQAINHLLDLGFNHADAATLVGEASKAKVEKHRDIAVGEVLTAYRERALNQAQARDHLTKLGYDRGERDLLLHVADLQESRHLQDQALNVIRGRYVQRHIEESEASRDLDKLGVPASRRGHLLNVWGIERSAVRKSLSEAQIARAFKDGLMNKAHALERIEALGYSPADAALLLGEAVYVKPKAHP